MRGKVVCGSWALAAARLLATAPGAARAAEPGVEKFQTDPAAALAVVLATLPKTRTRFETITLLAQQPPPYLTAPTPYLTARPMAC